MKAIHSRVSLMNIFYDHKFQTAVLAVVTAFPKPCAPANYKTKEAKPSKYENIEKKKVATLAPLYMPSRIQISCLIRIKRGEEEEEEIRGTN